MFARLGLVRSTEPSAVSTAPPIRTRSWVDEVIGPAPEESASSDNDDDFQPFIELNSVRKELAEQMKLAERLREEVRHAATQLEELQLQHKVELNARNRVISELNSKNLRLVGQLHKLEQYEFKSHELKHNSANTDSSIFQEYEEEKKVFQKTVCALQDENVQLRNELVSLGQVHCGECDELKRIVETISSHEKQLMETITTARNQLTVSDREYERLSNELVSKCAQLTEYEAERVQLLETIQRNEEKEQTEINRTIKQESSASLSNQQQPPFLLRSLSLPVTSVSIQCDLHLFTTPPQPPPPAVKVEGSQQQLQQSKQPQSEEKTITTQLLLNNKKMEEMLQKYDAEISVGGCRTTTAVVSVTQQVPFTPSPQNMNDSVCASSSSASSSSTATSMMTLLQQRHKNEIKRITQDNPDCIPVKCVRAEDTPDYPLLEKEKCAAKKKMTVSRFAEHMRTKLKLAPGEPLYIYYDADTCLPDSVVLEDIYNQCGNQDEYLRLRYSRYPRTRTKREAFNTTFVIPQYIIR